MWTIQERLTDLLKPNTRDRTISDVRIGLSYTAVRLNTGHAGVAWTPKSSTAGCTRLQNAGTLSGRPALEILAMLIDHQSSLARAVGLATANALLAAAPRKPTMEDEIISSLDVGPDDRVAMVGYFGPVVARLQKSGCQLDILELNSDHRMETLSFKEGRAALSRCTVAIITGTTLINATFDDIAARLGNHRAAVLLGPSSPLCDAVFHGTGITHVAGSRAEDGQKVMLTVATAPSTFRESGIPWEMEERVAPQYEDAFVDRIRTFVKNQPFIKYVQVWNELKGYWNTDLNRWDYEGLINSLLTQPQIAFDLRLTLTQRKSQLAKI